MAATAGSGRAVRAGRPLRAGLCLVLAAALLCPAAPAAAREADPWTGPDKALHLAAGTLLAGSSYALWIDRRDGRHWGALLGVGVGVTAGGLKELLDLAGTGRPSAKDFAWTALGSLLGTGLAMLIDLAARGARPAPRRHGEPAFP